MTHYASLGRGMVLCGLRIAACGVFGTGVDIGVCRSCARYVMRYALASEGSSPYVIRFWPVQVAA